MIDEIFQSNTKRFYQRMTINQGLGRIMKISEMNQRDALKLEDIYLSQRCQLAIASISVSTTINM